MCVQNGQPETELRRTANLTAILHKICITDEMLDLVLEMTFSFNTCLISKEMEQETEF
jgi:hypothetical protein